ncbi:acyltransferase family protein [Tardiphaga sp. 866_E4_N2_1]|uniref:acyltransferase family protein n=1 Tax=unclassified Tardiphaga TaxID=2631404 RepID=UPI003F2997E3
MDHIVLTHWRTTSSSINTTRLALRTLLTLQLECSGKPALKQLARRTRKIGPQLPLGSAPRAVGALLVVLYHAFELWGLRVDPAAPGVKWTNGAAGVDIFFAISGFVMVISSRRLIDNPGAWRVFLWHRMIRIVPFYWLLTTLKILGVLLPCLRRI